MTWILRGHVSVASDSTTAGLISSPNTQTRAALAAVLEPMVEDAAETIVPPIVYQVMADDPTIAAGAAAAAANALAAILGAAKCVHFEAGVLIYDGPNGPLATHYLIPDDTGIPIARSTLFPVPSASSPELIW